MAAMFGWTSTTFDKLFEKATSHLLLEPDWESILQICDSIRQGDVQPKYVVACIKKKLYATNPHVVLYTLQVLESCMKNCGSPFHAEVASRPFMEELKELVKTTTNDNVRSRLLELIQIWAHAFRNEPKYRAAQDIFNMIKVEGYKLQALKESDAMFAADTAPDWADGNCCHRCRTQFTVMQRKHHCRNCGQIFCNKCSSRSCPIPRFGIEKDVRVCEACWEKLNKPATTVPKTVSSSPENTAVTTSSDAPAARTKSEQELKEEEDLQLALALSQSEAEEKQKATKNNVYSNLIPSNQQDSVSAPERKPQASDSELDRYLNRTYWEMKQQQQREETVSPTDMRNSPVPSAPMSSNVVTNSYGISRINEKYQNGDVDELTDFLTNLRQTVEIFVNRMKSNSSRGRPIANDTHVQSLFMNITNMHSQLLKHIQEQDDMRAYYERLQDKLGQARDARAALDALREEHRERLRREAEEAERIRQIQMAHKLEIMRQKKQEYLQYQRQLALQRMQEQEREMQLRQEQQKAQYHMPMQPPPGVPQQNYGVPHATYAPPGPPPQQPYVVMQADPNVHGMPPHQPYHPQYKPPQMQEYHPAYNMQVPGHMQAMPQGCSPYPQQQQQPPPTSMAMGPPPPMMMPQGQPMGPPPQQMGMIPPTSMPQGPPIEQPPPQQLQSSPPQQLQSPPQEMHQDPLIVFD